MVRSSSLKAPNNFLRKHRKWPRSPFKTKWHHAFDEQEAMRTLKQAAATTVMAPPRENPGKPEQPHLLSALIHSFHTYNCHPTPNAYLLVLKTLAETSQFHHIPLVLDHLERVEKFETPEFVFAELIKVYGNADKLQEAVDLFCGIARFRCMPSVYSLNSLLSVLCRKSEGLRMVPQVLLKSRYMNIRIEESTFRILVSALCRIRRVGYAIEILNCMLNDGYELDMRICSLILSSFCEQTDLSGVDAMGFLERMRKLGFCPGMRDYSNVIRFLVKGGKGSDALEVLNRMKEDGIKPDIVCYTMVLDGLFQEGDYGRADELFDELLVLGLVPDVYTYNVYIHGMCKQNNVEAGIKMIASMEELGCKPNVITYNTIIDALCKVGELSRIKEVLKEMGRKGVEFNLRTYRIMLEGLVGKGEIMEACALCEEVLEKCSSPRCAAFDKIIFGLCQKGLDCKAEELMNKIIGKKVVPGPMAWEALLLSFGSRLGFSETILRGLVNGEPSVNSPI